ncbi:hypothetical protein HYT05_03750 [Candidatus Kaiserbacteria bacterium]|nr:hypothetical protein [Candidatus Kaiserbacteria bacterium]
MIMRLMLALALLFAPLMAYGEEEGLPRPRVQYVKIALWAHYCVRIEGAAKEYCVWTYITDNVIAADNVGPMWTTGIGCVMQALPFLAQFVEQNPSYQRGYFESWRCFMGDDRPPLDV